MDRRKNIRSFDVFATCLARRFAAPSDLFLDLGRRMKFEGYGLSQETDAETFWAARIEAERRTSLKSSAEEITLDEIWAELARMMGDEKIRQFQRVEMELESENVVAIGPARREVTIARAAGSRIVFVSDTYLPRQFVEAELRHHGFAMDGDGIYVSSEIKKRKRTGRLFKHLLLTEDIRPHQIVHTGDDELSDVRVPRRLGIKCKLAARTLLTECQREILTLEE